MDTKITIDAHSLVWYIDESMKGNLTKKALQTIREAQVKGTIYVPAIVLMEIVYLIEKGKINTSFAELMSKIEASACYEIIPIDAKLIKIAVSLKRLEIHDRLVLATTILTDSALVSKDRMLKIRGAKVVW